MFFANEILMDLLIGDFDGCSGGDPSQFWKEGYTRTRLTRVELFRPATDHTRVVLGGHGTPRFDEEVCRCEPPSADRGRKIHGDCDNLDALPEKESTMYDGGAVGPRKGSSRESSVLS